MSKGITKIQLALAVAKARRLEAINSRNIILIRTEIPADAKNPTRDFTVELGEILADLLMVRVKELDLEIKTIEEQVPVAVERNDRRFIL